MTKTVKRKPKTLEMKGVMVSTKQNHKKTKNVGEPHTLIQIAVPLMDNRLFEEMCFNDGYRLCLKIEYLPNKNFTVKEKSKT